MIIVCCP